MRWLKVPEAAREWAGGVSTKTIYTAIRDGELKAARIGAGRNLLLCEQHVAEWLLTCVARPVRPSTKRQLKPEARDVIVPSASWVEATLDDCATPVEGR